jgi:hypothetical protein
MSSSTCVFSRTDFVFNTVDFGTGIGYLLSRLYPDTAAATRMTRLNSRQHFILISIQSQLE